jgi:hypothetical protein
MAVKVYGKPTTHNYDHSEGTGVDVRDGHLLVLAGVSVTTPRQIAVYTPGTWIRAEVTEVTK